MSEFDPRYTTQANLSIADVDELYATLQAFRIGIANATQARDSALAENAALAKRLEEAESEHDSHTESENDELRAEVERLRNVGGIGLQGCTCWSYCNQSRGHHEMCNLSRLAALEAMNRALRTENEALKMEEAGLAQDLSNQREELEESNAEVAALRKDAERWRHLREDSGVASLYEKDGEGGWLLKYGRVLAALDAQIAAEKP